MDSQHRFSANQNQVNTLRHCEQNAVRMHKFAGENQFAMNSFLVLKNYESKRYDFLRLRWGHAITVGGEQNFGPAMKSKKVSVNIKYDSRIGMQWNS